MFLWGHDLWPQGQGHPHVGGTQMSHGLSKRRASEVTPEAQRPKGGHAMIHSLLIVAGATLLTLTLSLPCYALCPLDPECTNNPLGAGSPLAPNGLNNPLGQYGSPVSPDSWTNPYAINPPRVYDPQTNQDLGILAPSTRGQRLREELLYQPGPEPLTRGERHRRMYDGRWENDS